MKIKMSKNLGLSMWTGIATAAGIAAITLATPVAPANAASLAVDLGSSGTGGVDTQDVEAGYEEWTIARDNTLDATPGTAEKLFSTTFGNYDSGSGPEAQINIIIEADDGENLDSRNRSATGTLADLVEDFWFGDVGGNYPAVFIRLQGIKAGDFVMTTYHNDTDFPGIATKALLNDVNGTDQPVGTVTDVADQLDGITFNFTSNGIDDVVVTLDWASTSRPVNINGFVISEAVTVPEPASLAMIGCAGLLMLQRSRRR